MIAALALEAPYVDACADDLRFALGLPPLPALRRLALDLGGLAVELRILGGSHQVLVDGGARLSETLACAAALGEAAGGPLPATVERRIGGRRYAMTASVEPLGGRAAALVEEHVGDPRALVGIFPGSPEAFTALRARPQPSGGVAWTTLHAYPQTGELVRTETTLDGPA